MYNTRKLFTYISSIHWRFIHNSQKNFFTHQFVCVCLISIFSLFSFHFTALDFYLLFFTAPLYMRTKTDVYRTICDVSIQRNMLFCGWKEKGKKKEKIIEKFFNHLMCIHDTSSHAKVNFLYSIISCMVCDSHVL